MSDKTLDFITSSEKTIKEIEKIRSVYLRCTFCFEILLNESGQVKFGVKKIGTGQYEQKWCVSCESCKRFSKEHIELIDVDRFAYNCESYLIKHREDLKKLRTTVFKDVSATTWLSFLASVHFGPCPLV